MAMVAGRGRVDLRFAVDNDGELYILTKSDGMIRKVVGARAGTAPEPAATTAAPAPGQNITTERARTLRNPVASTDQWDHGSTDGDIFAVTRRGVPATMMPGFDGRIPDDDIWNIVNYLRSLPKK